MSLLSQERGLKSDVNLTTSGPDIVAPLAGAWIEIKEVGRFNHDELSLLSQERGLK